MDSLYQTIINSLSSAMITVDVNGRVISANIPALRILGYDNDKNIIGEHIDEILPANGSVNPFIESINKKKPLKRKEFTVINKKGEKLYLGITTSLIENAKYNFTGVIGLMTDLTKIKNMQDKLKQKENLAILGEMTAVMAHEIKNPLTGIKFGIEYLKTILEDNQDAVESIELILNEIKQLERIARDMTNFARMPNISSEKFNLVQLIEDKIKIHKSEMKEKNININFDKCSDCVNYYGDPYLLSEVFNNLLRNSIEAFDNSCNKKNINVEIRFNDDNDTCLIIIKDTGIGIKEENQKKIFMPFFTMKRGGTGLGLPTVQRIVIAHNGALTLNSKLGKGTTFIIELPSIICNE